MPELPEVETIVRELRPHLTGAKVRRVVVARRDVLHGDPRPIEKLARDRTIERVARRAKRIVMTLDMDLCIVVHLGMSGRLSICDPGEPLLPHTHLRFLFHGRKPELRFRDPRRFGGVWCLGNGDVWRGRTLGEVGVEPFDLRPKAFTLLLTRKRPVKSLLLDQTLIAGLGNIYCDESLFGAGIHPLRIAETLSDVEGRRLLRSIKSTLRRSIRYHGTTLLDYRRANGEFGGFRRLLRVYGRDGEPCRKCRTPLQRVVLTGRSTVFCPRCQPQ